MPPPRLLAVLVLLAASAIASLASASASTATATAATATASAASANQPPAVCRGAFPDYPNASLWESSMQPSIRIQMGPCLGCACVVGGSHSRYATALCAPPPSPPTPTPSPAGNSSYDGCLGAVGECQDEVRFSADCQNVTITRAKNASRSLDNKAGDDPIAVLGTVWYRVA